MRIGKHWLRMIALAAISVLFLQFGPASAAPITSGSVYKYAPKLRFHPSEDKFPVSPLTFIDHSRLRWKHDYGCNRDYDFSNPDRSDLGDGVYGHRTTSNNSNCYHGSTTWKSNKYTAPWEHYTLGGWSNPGGGEGFYLDLPNDDRDGGGLQGDEPVIVYTSPGKWVQYWYNFGDSRRPAKDSTIGHEGDWEHIALKVNSSGTPTHVEYSFHHAKCELPWASAPKGGTGGTQPFVYIALHSHASYPFVDSKPAKFSDGSKDKMGYGSWWDAQENLNYLPNYSFYPYGGGWGLALDTDDSSGPSSPGAWRGGPIFNNDKSDDTNDPTCAHA